VLNRETRLKRAIARRDKAEAEIAAIQQEEIAEQKEEPISCDCGYSEKIGEAKIVKMLTDGYQPCGEDNYEYSENWIWICPKCGLQYIIDEDSARLAFNVGKWYRDNVGWRPPEKYAKRIELWRERKHREYVEQQRQYELERARRVLRDAGEL